MLFSRVDLILVQVLMDIDRTEEKGATRKRIRRHLRDHELRDLITNNASKVDQAQAIACFRAEEIRSGAEHRDMDREVALSAIQRNPFRWEVSG